ncbi:MAG: orotidine-5'-phosphate decarboxylase [Candidatus Omnitrophota bacterium]|nr:orotidine-5'-phosphate decarboxylase [Candidatus Omnitrophota bacterium]
MKTDPKDKLIVALDVPTFEEARQLVDILKGAVDIFKIGSQLFTACGPVVVRHVLANGKKVFLDLKYHDIPHTVANAVAAAVSLGQLGHDVLAPGKKQKSLTNGLFMLTVHTLGGEEMLEQAVASATQTAQDIGVTKPFILGITVLTSEEKKNNIHSIVLERAHLAKKCGLDGVVASSQEASIIRQEFGRDFIVVTPGIRPSGKEAGDQKRITTPAEAINNGSDYLVIGRPIVEDKDPLQAAKNILQNIKQTNR